MYLEGLTYLSVYGRVHFKIWYMQKLSLQQYLVLYDLINCFLFRLTVAVSWSRNSHNNNIGCKAMSQRRINVGSTLILRLPQSTLFLMFVFLLY